MRKILKISALILTACAALWLPCPPRADGAAQRGSGDGGGPQFALRDFDAVYALDAPFEGRIYKVRLSSEIFSRVRQSYRRDLAIFNASGDVVPFALAVAEDGYAEAPPYEAERFSSPLFPLPEPESGFSEGRVTIRTDNSGRVIEVGGGGKTARVGTDRILYLIDMSAAPTGGGNYEGTIAGYRIELPIEGQSDTLANASVYASNSLRDWENLSAWDKIGENEPLVHLKRGDARVSSGVIEAAGGEARYLLIEMTGKGNVISGDAEISVLRKIAAAPPEPDGASFDGIASSDGDFIYDTGGAYPADEINFALKSPGILRVTAQSREEGGEWRTRFEAPISFIKGPDGEARNGPFSTRGRPDRHWRLKTGNSPAVEPPTMQIFWRPREAVFLAQGKPPYTLAVGSEKTLPSPENPDLMGEALSRVTEGDMLEAKIAGEVSNDSVETRQAKTGPGDKKWPRYAVWGTLTGCALLMSWIAWRLMGKNDHAA
ncbi:MAG: DUF3999 domain-containing protein [Synergistaceae bacterium]|jgi:hypothetical protein|nr:DUF3999 domain-containing protein [Synergistaceae bacterium]